MTAAFEFKPAKRERVPLLVGLYGPSGSGKTYSALRLAAGMQKVTGGRIVVVDTEARRALHYSDLAPFLHCEFAAPFNPLRYLEVIEAAAKEAQGGPVIVDSFSHEHEGQGGVLEMHEAELERLSRGEQGRRDKVNMLAWAKPKAERRRLINGVLQLGVNLIACFRAKEKIKLVTGQQPTDLGWMPIAGEEFIYELTATCLLYPQSQGTPTWNPTQPGEKALCKLPRQFAETLGKAGQLTESVGEKLAQWAAGDSAPRGAPAATTDGDLEATLAEIALAENVDALDEAIRVARTRKWNSAQGTQIKKAIDEKRATWS